MMIKIKAPEGYKLHDSLTDKEYSEVVVNEKDRGRYELVPANDKPVTVNY